MNVNREVVGIDVFSAPKLNLELVGTAKTRSGYVVNAKSVGKHSFAMCRAFRIPSAYADRSGDFSRGYRAVGGLGQDLYDSQFALAVSGPRSIDVHFRRLPRLCRSYKIPGVSRSSKKAQ